MFKTISAALLAVSVLAAPALAATADKTAQAPVTRTTAAPVIKAEQSKSKLLNANAKMGRHHRHHAHHRHMGALKTHASPKVATKPMSAAARRGGNYSAGVVGSTLPRRACGYQTRPTAIASPMAVGWC